MTWSFHCIHRPLLVKEPSFSIQCVHGSRKTSVWILLGSIPGPCQNSELVVGKGSMITSHLRLACAWRIWVVSGPMLVAIMPERKSPSIFPLRAWSKIEIHEEFAAGFGR